jgi:hypothetical protein
MGDSFAASFDGDSAALITLANKRHNVNALVANDCDLMIPPIGFLSGPARRAANRRFIERYFLF